MYYNLSEWLKSVLPRIYSFIILFLIVNLLVGCVSFRKIKVHTADDCRRIAQNIAAEKGSYFIGRRFYKTDYKMWGWLKKAGEPWKKAKLVMLNEQYHWAPDREKHMIGYDNNYEYFVYGKFSKDSVYEPASDSFYPEFILDHMNIRFTNPPLIFNDKRYIDPKVRILAPPY